MSSFLAVAEVSSPSINVITLNECPRSFQISFLNVVHEVTVNEQDEGGAIDVPIIKKSSRYKTDTTVLKLQSERPHLSHKRKGK